MLGFRAVFLTLEEQLQFRLIPHCQKVHGLTLYQTQRQNKQIHLGKTRLFTPELNRKMRKD